jgi:hypothetical protein
LLDRLDVPLAQSRAEPAPDYPAAHYEDVHLIPGHLVDHAFPVCRGQFRRHQISALP